MSRLAVGAAIAGLLLLSALVAWQGWHEVLGAVAHAGWALLLLAPLRLLTLALDVRAWQILLDPLLKPEPDPALPTPLAGTAGPAPGFPFLLWVAAVREAVNRLLPAAGVGGEVVGVRLVRTRVPDTAAVAASVIVEVLLTIVVLYLFCGLGVVLMARIAAGMHQVWVIAASLALSLPLPLLAWWLLRHGALFQRLERWSLRLLGARAAPAPGAPALPGLDGARLDAAVARLFGHHGRLLRALGWQLLSYLLGSLETWYALRLLGHPVDLATAIAIEALTQAARHASFLVPAGLGVQEAAVLLFGYLAGVGGEVALSLALVKRMREIVFGLPALLSWHWFEAARLRRTLPAQPLGRR
ncbi:lysylphosphatidylglycerol synthase domain-containing protein [Massilia sp. GCM10023247]|uniref:lysylphosphatidylglycerol synthase domain-containing protein n=1 Tax=Massilia sp. GCM10023247 TaxID=3252643 RepID=UPI0036191A1A